VVDAEDLRLGVTRPAAARFLQIGAKKSGAVDRKNTRTSAGERSSFWATAVKSCGVWASTFA